MKDQAAIDALIAEARASIKSLRKLDMPADYRAKLMTDARDHLALLRDLKKPEPPKTNALVIAVAKSLRVSLQQLEPLDPALMRFAAERAVRVVEANLQQREALNTRHSKPGGSRDKKARMLAEWQSKKYKTKLECAEKAGPAIGLGLEAAKNALRNK